MTSFIILLNPDGLTMFWQLIMLASHRQEFIAAIHSGITGGHMAKRRTAAAIQATAYWPTSLSDLGRYLKACPACSHFHQGSTPKNAKMQTSLVREPWDGVSIDITGLHP